MPLFKITTVFSLFSMKPELGCQTGRSCFLLNDVWSFLPIVQNQHEGNSLVCCMLLTRKKYKNWHTCEKI